MPPNVLLLGGYPSNFALNFCCCFKIGLWGTCVVSIIRVTCIIRSSEVRNSFQDVSPEGTNTYTVSKIQNGIEGRRGWGS